MNSFKRRAALLFLGVAMPCILVGGSVSAGGVPTLQQTVSSNSLQILNMQGDISVINSSIQELTVGSNSQQQAIHLISSDLQTQGAAVQNLNTTVNGLSLNVQTLQDKLNILTSRVDALSPAAPKDFSFFTNHPFKHGNYFMSPAFDAKDYTKFSMTFTCTSGTNDEIKYWIETSADGINWSPWGYYHVNCNGIYGGASINAGQLPARYFALAVFQISSNNNTNTITSVGRFSN